MKFLVHTKLQLPPETLTRGLPPPDPRSLCPQLNLLKPPPQQNPWVRHWIHVGYNEIANYVPRRLLYTYKYTLFRLTQHFSIF